MSLTPIEGRNEPGGPAKDEPRNRGVRQRLWQAVTRVVGGVLGKLTGTAIADDGADAADSPERADVERTETALRPAGQSRLERDPDARQLPANPPPEPPVDTGGGAATEADVDGDRLRIHRPDSQEAYIVSDVYERIER